jgi:transcriptional regulator with XRE-family HTH domain
MPEDQGKMNQVPNEQLRWERQRRGWSRAYIAEQIGIADPKTVGRWERGSAYPSAYFLQKICELFQMPAEALGLCQKEKPQVAAKYFSHDTFFRPGPAEAFYDPELPPALANGLVGRKRLLHLLKMRLVSSGSLTSSVLSGLPGVGKTALAVEVARDDDLTQYFSDGILWVSLGPDADVPGELRRWSELLGVDQSVILHQERQEDWIRAIHAKIGMRKMLLIIDDAWECQDALAFKLGGPNCEYLITTRIPTIALCFAGTRTITVDELADAESLELLARFVPEIVAQETTALLELIHLVGNLPLALQLIGIYLQSRIYSGQPRRWRAALEQLKQAETRLQLALPRTILERQKGLPLDAPISLQAAIELSYQRLTPATQQALTALATLPAKPGSFSEEAALALPRVTLDSLDNLLDIGLLESSGLERYTLHQTIVDFVRYRMQDQMSSLEYISPQEQVHSQFKADIAYVHADMLLKTYQREEALPTF